MDGRLAIIGTGTMGEALLTGLLRAGTVAPDRVVCTARDQDHLRALADEHGVRATSDNRAAVADADVVLVALKPQVVPEVLAEVGPDMSPEQLLISVAAGLTTASLESHLPEDTPVVRVMTNTPALVDEAVSVLAAGADASEDDLAVTEQLLGAVGSTLRLDERHLHAVTALSGSGPAYLFLVAEAMIEAGLLVGLSRETATELVVQTVVGSAAMLRDSDRTATELRGMVTSPGGTTIAALRELEAGGLRSALTDAVAAAHRRSGELGGGS